MVLLNNPFRRTSATAPKWRHRSTTMQMKPDEDEVDDTNKYNGKNGYYHYENSTAPQLLAPPTTTPYNASTNNISVNSSPTYNTKQQMNVGNKTTPTKATAATAANTAPSNNMNTVVPANSDSVLHGIGDYIFLSRLGDGKFSQVMLAEHYLTGDKVAIKIINKRAHQYRVMYRLVREIQLMEVLHQHPNIVTLYETYETADSLYLVMEYVPGLNLEDYLKTLTDHGDNNKNRPAYLDEEKARHIFRQIVKAVDYCHSRWVVHRDLKTPNILLTGEDLNQVKIADFGLGNRYGLQRLKTVCGSMLYYSPEIIAARSYIGPEVDTWCLGILLFRMTAGTELFAHAKTPAELKKYILCRQYRFPSHLSPELQSTIQKCLSTDRGNRLSLETMLRQDPWFTKNGTLSSDDIFRSASHDSSFNVNPTDDQCSRLIYNAKDATQLYAESFRSEDLSRVQLSAQQTKKQCKQDLLLEEEEKRRHCQQQHYDTQHSRRMLFPCRKTVIYHITHSSTYFTSTDTSMQTGDEEQAQIIADLNQQLLLLLKRVQLRALDEKDIPSKSAISQAFQKLNTKEQLQHSKQPRLRKAASVLSLFNQKTNKDHIHYFSIKPVPTTLKSNSHYSQYASVSTTTNNNQYTSTSLASSTMISTSEFSMSSSIVNSVPASIPDDRTPADTSKRKSISHRLSMAFLPHTNPEKSISYEEMKHKDEEQEKQQQLAKAEMTHLFRHACDILGITYYQSSSSQLVCLLTLRNCKVKSSQDQKQEYKEKMKSEKLKKKKKKGNYKKRLSRLLDPYTSDHDNDNISDDETEDYNDQTEETDASNMTTTAFTTSSLLKSKLFNNKKYSTISNTSRTTTLTMLTTVTMNSYNASSATHVKKHGSRGTGSNSHLSKWWNKQLNRFSNSHHRHQQQPSALSTTTTTTSASASTTLVLGDSTYQTKSSFSSSMRKKTGKRHTKEEEEAILILESNNADERNASSTAEDQDGFVTLNIDISCIQSGHGSDFVLAVRYVKVKGSSKVFMLAKGWLQMVLSQNYDEVSRCSTRSEKKEE